MKIKDLENKNLLRIKSFTKIAQVCPLRLLSTDGTTAPFQFMAADRCISAGAVFKRQKAKGNARVRSLRLLFTDGTMAPFKIMAHDRFISAGAIQAITFSGKSKWNVNDFDHKKEINLFSNKTYLKFSNPDSSVSRKVKFSDLLSPKPPWPSPSILAYFRLQAINLFPKASDNNKKEKIDEMIFQNYQNKYRIKYNFWTYRGECDLNPDYMLKECDPALCARNIDCFKLTGERNTGNDNNQRCLESMDERIFHMYTNFFRNTVLLCNSLTAELNSVKSERVKEVMRKQECKEREV